MSRRYFRHYFVHFGADAPYKASAAEWRAHLAAGHIRPVSPGSRTARLAPGVIAWIAAGRLQIAAIVRIRTTWAAMMRAWLYAPETVSAQTVGESWEQRRERVRLEQDRDAHNEAMLWRMERNTKGRNEYAYVPAERKIEILKALRSSGRC